VSFNRRNRAIRESRNLSDIGPGRLLFITDLKDPILARPDKNGIIKPTIAMHRLEKTVEKIKPAIVIIENAADVFAGNENYRDQVQPFVRVMLGGLCVISDAATMLLQHPSVSGIQEKLGRSGSTGWNNAGRWRLNFTFYDTSDDTNDTRQLKTEKLNYGRRGEKFKVRWEKGVFVPDLGTSTTGQAANVSIDETFMCCLDVATAQGRTVSDSTGRNYAPALFERMPEAKGTASKAFEGSMERLFSAKRILVTVSGKGNHRKRSLTRTPNDMGTPKNTHGNA